MSGLIYIDSLGKRRRLPSTQRGFDIIEKSVSKRSDVLDSQILVPHLKKLTKHGGAGYVIRNAFLLQREIRRLRANPPIITVNRMMGGYTSVSFSWTPTQQTKNEFEDYTARREYPLTKDMDQYDNIRMFDDNGNVTRIDKSYGVVVPSMYNPEVTYNKQRNMLEEYRNGDTGKFIDDGYIRAPFHTGKWVMTSNTLNYAPAPYKITELRRFRHVEPSVTSAEVRDCLRHKIFARAFIVVMGELLAIEMSKLPAEAFLIHMANFEATYTPAEMTYEIESLNDLNKVK
ncbi:hypothetical protein T492DRAFT_837359 [Pavlovales sp. CCMP2436]|nr:hypothetical protein T492DRAFT_837359 [Pavlovales sp. CCMP2436]